MKKSILIGLTIVILSSIISYFLGRSSLGTPATRQHLNTTSHNETTDAKTIWTCSMHPQIQLEDKVPCPICGMELTPLLKNDSEKLGDSQVKMSPLAQKLADIETWPAERKSISLAIKVPGKVSYDETKIKSISARFSGRLDRLYLDSTGAPVQKGEHLFDIYSPQVISAQEELIQAISSFEKLQEDTLTIVRESSMLSIQSSEDKLKLWGFSQKQIDKIKSNKKALDQNTTHSPISGIVVKKHLKEGQYIKEGDAIYTIADLSSLWVELEAYETDLAWIHYAQKVTLRSQAYPDQNFEGKVSFISPELNEKTRTIKIRVNIDNSDKKLKPGMFIRAEIQANLDQDGHLADHELAGQFICPMHPEIISEKVDNCPRCGMALEASEKLGFSKMKQDTELPLLIPSSAALITGKRAIVYVKVPKKEAVFEGREIQIAARAGQFYIVKSGLEENELIVKKGAFKIDSALQIQAKKSMMSGDAKHQLGKKPNSSPFIRPSLVGKHPFRHELKAALNSLSEINRQLSLDDIKELPQLSQKLHKKLKNLNFETLSKKERNTWKAILLQAQHQVHKLSKSKSIEVSRKVLEKINTLAIKALKAFGSPSPIKIAYCSMAFDDQGAEWLQTADRIENPYFGSMMYRCGDFKSSIVPPTSSAGSTIVPMVENSVKEPAND